MQKKTTMKVNRYNINLIFSDLQKLILKIKILLKIFQIENKLKE